MNNYYYNLKKCKTMNKKLLLFDAFLGIFFGISSYYYISIGFNSETLTSLISSSVPILIFVGLLIFRVGIHKTYKNLGKK